MLSSISSLLRFPSTNSRNPAVIKLPTVGPGSNTGTVAIPADSAEEDPLRQRVVTVNTSWRSAEINDCTTSLS